jgi:hypothetical protein
MATTRVLSTHYKVQVVSPDDGQNVTINVDINKTAEGLAGTSEETVVDFVRRYLQTLTNDPIIITRTQTIETQIVIDNSTPGASGA